MNARCCLAPKTTFSLQSKLQRFYIGKEKKRKAIGDYLILPLPVAGYSASWQSCMVEGAQVERAISCICHSGMMLQRLIRVERKEPFFLMLNSSTSTHHDFVSPDKQAHVCPTQVQSPMQQASLTTSILLVQCNSVSKNLFCLLLLSKELDLQHICSADNLEIGVME